MNRLADALPPAPGVVSQLISYPVKGCAGVPVARATVTSAGLTGDRTFLVVSPDGVFRSQRRDPALALIVPALSPDGAELTLAAPGAGRLDLAVTLDAPRREIVLFGQRYQGIDQGEAVASWLTRVLGTPSRLVRVPPEHDRVTDGEVTGTSAYADSCAVHVISRSSLELLQERLRQAGRPSVPMARFRPNMVVDGWPEPHTEDHVRRLRAGTCALVFAKLAIRCAVTTIDQESGLRCGPEPLRTLATYRRTRDGLAFGAKFAVERPGDVAVGDTVATVLRARPLPSLHARKNRDETARRTAIATAYRS